MSGDKLSRRDQRKIEKFFQEKESRQRSPSSSGPPGRLNKSGKQRPPGQRPRNFQDQEEDFSPPFRPRLVDRYLVASAWQGLPLILCLNKSDLGTTTELETLLDGYAGLGLRVLRTSATTGSGIPQLIETITGKISLLSGHSGVGKSSLLNTLEPDLELRTGQVTTAIAGQGKGTHTTTAARLIKLSLPDTHLVDSPGIRAFGLGQLGPSEIAAGFPEMRRWEPDCRVRGYLHNGEPDCAVASGMSRSAFGQHRLDSYRRLLAVHSQR